MSKKKKKFSDKNRKEKFLDFLERFYLDGSIDKALIELNDNELYTSAFNSDEHVYCEIKMKDNPFNENNLNISVSDAGRLRRILRGFNDPDLEVYYNQNNANDPNPHSLVINENNIRSNYLLTKSGVISFGKDIPNNLDNSLFELKIDDEIKEQFDNFKYMLKDETRSFSFFQRNNDIHILFGMERYVGSNNISIKLDIIPNQDFRNEIIFSIDTFYSIIKANEDCDITISVIDRAMLVKCVSEHFVNKYLVASSKNKQ